MKNEQDVNKNKNNKRIKEYNKQLKSEKFDVSNELKFNEEDEAIIECKIGDTNNIFNKYDILKDRTISDEFNEFLMEETEIIPLQYNLEVKLHVAESCSEESEQQIRRAIKRHFSFNITKYKLKIKKNAMFAGIMFLLGIVGLFLLPSFYKLDSIFPFYESILIVTWFLIWESSDLAIFARGKLRRQKINSLRLYNANITFIREKELTVKTTVIVDKATIISDKSTVYANSANKKDISQKNNVDLKKEVKEIKGIIKPEQ